LVTPFNVEVESISPFRLVSAHVPTITVLLLGAGVLTFEQLLNNKRAKTAAYRSFINFMFKRFINAFST
jgi:hypothetical protein